MKKALLFLFLAAAISGKSQFIFQQFFDGADTIQGQSIFIYFQPNDSIWQIGQPSKTLFHAAASAPKALVTDTLNPYPNNASSSFTFDAIQGSPFYGILAVQWMQKLDLDSVGDGALIEFSVDNGATWENPFNHPNVYNFFGFDWANVYSFPQGDLFSGIDTTWQNVWLCFDANWAQSLLMRFTLLSDSVSSNKEGWMLDNFIVSQTFAHTINELVQEKYIVVSPIPSTGLVNINTRKTNDYHIIEQVVVRDMTGKIVKQFGKSPVKVSLDLSDLADGKYILLVKTNQGKETIPITIAH